MHEAAFPKLRPAFAWAPGFDPWQNQGLEKYWLETVGPEEIILYLWQNSNTVVIGKNQNAWRECKVAELERDGGKLARRISGGGAVYHDLGNLNFTFLCHARHYSVARNQQVLLAALLRLGVEARITGRNDLTVEERKVSGNAFYEGRTCFHHGTLLIGVDKEKMARYLQPSAKKLAGKGVDSVRSRVANLAEFLPGLTPERLGETLVEALGAAYGETPRALPLPDPETGRWAALTGEFADPDWRLGRAIPCDLVLEERFPWGEVELRLAADRGRVAQAQLFTDALHDDLAALVGPALTGQPFSGRTLGRALRALEGPQAELADIASLLEQEDF